MSASNHEYPVTVRWIAGKEGVAESADGLRIVMQRQAADSDTGQQRRCERNPAQRTATACRCATLHAPGTPFGIAFVRRIGGLDGVDGAAG